MLSFPYTQLGAEMWMNQHNVSNPQDVIEQTIDEFGTEVPLYKIIQYYLFRPSDIEKVFNDPRHAKDIVEYMLDSEYFQLEGIAAELVELNWKKVALVAYVLQDDDGLLNQFFVASNSGCQDSISEVIFLDGMMEIVFEESNV